MKEIGGYIELERNHMPMLHSDAIALNCGRNCLAYLIRAKKIKKIMLPYFLCDSVRNLCKKEKVDIRYYHVNEHFFPKEVGLLDGEWLYIVNYYGQVSDKQILGLKEQYKNIIVDNSQAYFSRPVRGVDTLYTCRKFFGVPDGAFLYTDVQLDEKLPEDESFDRMRFLLGRFERSASEFYGEYAANNKLFAKEPIKQMSKLTKNLLHGIDYELVAQRRLENFSYLDVNLGELNKLQICAPDGAFSYPLWVENGAEIRSRLIEKKIFIPTLWPNVLKDVAGDELEYKMVRDILPIPVDQRYSVEDMEYLVQEIKSSIT